MGGTEQNKGAEGRRRLVHVWEGVHLVLVGKGVLRARFGLGGLGGSSPWSCRGPTPHKCVLQNCCKCDFSVGDSLR